VSLTFWTIRSKHITWWDRLWLHRTDIRLRISCWLY